MRPHPLRHRVHCLTVAAVLLTATIPAASAPPPSVTGHYENALRLMKKGDGRGAVIELKNALQANPDDLSARMLLGRAYLKLNQGEAAAKELLRARRDGASDSVVLVPLGRAYLLLHRFERVLNEIRTTGLDRATAADVSVIRGNAQLALRRLDAAEQSYRSALTMRPDDSEAHTGLARILVMRRDVVGADREIKLALKIRRRSAEAWYLQGRIAEIQGKRETALNAFDRAVEINPHRLDALLSRAGLLIDAERYDEADRDISKVRRLNPHVARAAYLRAVVLTKRGRKKEAEQALIEAEQILRGLPAEAIRNDPPTMLLFGLVSYLRGEDEPASRYLSAYLARNPGHAGARKMLASIALRRGKAARAIELLKDLVPRGKDDLDLLILYSDALIRSGRADEASGLLDRATAMAKPGSDAMSRLVNLRIAAGDDAEAIRLLKGERARDPASVAIATTLFTTQMRRQHFDDALATINRIIARHPEEPALHNLAGAAYLGLKKVDSARRSFETALKVSPDYVPALANLGKLALNLGHKADARQKFLRILDKDPENGNAMSLLAEIDRREGNIDGAFRWLEKARTSSRDSRKATLKLIDLDLATNKAADAVRLARDLNRLHPDDLASLAALGRAQLAAGQHDAAADVFRQLASRATETKSTEWLYRAARGFIAIGDGQAARTALRSVLKFDGRNVRALAALIDLDLAARKPDDAMALADRVAALAPSAPTGDVLRGKIHMWLRQYKEAARAYGAAFQKAPSTALAARLYEARRAAGQDALGFVVDWAKKNPKDRTAQRLLAAAYTFAGRAAEGIALYEHLLEKEPDNVEYLNNIAILYQRAGDPRAAAFARRAYEASPAHPGLLDTYGWILVQQGKVRRGLSLLRNAQQRAPNLPEIRYHMAVALSALGQKRDARRELRAALDYGQPFDGIEHARKLLKKLAQDR